MNAEKILSITKCGDLFPYGEDNVKIRYKELAKEWHPDMNPDPRSADVFAKITELYNRALLLLADEQWEKTDYILISKKTGRKIALNYDTCFDFELGTCYVTKTKVVYKLKADKEKYYNNAVFRIHGLTYKDRTMEQNFSRILPKLYDCFETKQNEYVIVLEKPEDVYPLKTVLDYFSGKMDDRHVAWIMSRLCNLTCYLKFNGLVHNGIHISNCFLSPKEHAVYLLGGWWYTTKEEEKMIGISKDIFQLLSISAKADKKSETLTDLESVKLLGRQLLGEANCRKLSLDASVPEPFRAFLINASGENPYEEFSRWDHVLKASYGERRFVTMKIEDVYRKKGV